MDGGAYTIHDQAKDTEWYLCCALLQEPRRIESVADMVKPEHFADPDTERVYSTLLAMYQAGAPIDAITVTGRLGDDWRQTIAQMAGELVQPSATVEYAKTVVDGYTRRRIIETAEAVIARANTDRTANASTILSDAEQELFHLGEHGLNQGGLRQVGHAIDAALATVDAVYRSKGEIIGVPTGLTDLDKCLGGLRAPDLVVLAGRPAMGKTALALNIAEYGARNRGPVAIYSLEMGESQLGMRLITTKTGIPTEALRAGPLSAEQVRHMVEVGAELRGLPLYIDEGRERTVGSIRAHARRLKRRHGLALIVVDYLQLMIGGAAENRVQEISRITRDLKMMAMDLDVPVLVLSQLSRAVEQREDKRPHLADLRESGSIEQDADSVIFVYRPEYYLREPERRDGEETDKYMRRVANHEEQAKELAGIAELIVAKNRHGSTRTVRAHWDGRWQRFSNLTRG